MKCRLELGKYFNSLGFKTGAEIGAAAGKFSRMLCKDIPDLKLICIDLWEKSPLDFDNTPQYKAVRNLRDIHIRLDKYPGVTFIKGESLKIAETIEDESLDFVYIDASHDFDSVMQDIIVWSKKVRSGGVVSGHDYSKRKVGVKIAVDAYTENHNIELNVIPYNTKNPAENKEPSFWWIKP